MGGVLLLLSKVSFYGTILILVILILVLSFKFNKKMDNKDYNEVSNWYIASYFDGEYQNEIPGKDDGYVVEKIVCDNGAIATWDNEEWVINIRNATKKIKCSIYFVFKTEYVFDYTGTEQIFTVPQTGTYKIETWGAQGGSAYDSISMTTILGGYGGYSAGTIALNKNEILYLNVGQKGIDNCNTADNSLCLGGYNGGGSGRGNNSKVVSSSGGGATNIATSSGLLATFSSYTNNILIVSSGGGGSGYAYGALGNDSQRVDGQGGSGGGFKGNDGLDNWGIGMGKDNTYGFLGTGATQYSAGYVTTSGTIRTDLSGSFGQGGNQYEQCCGGAGGGSGYYGGGGSARCHGGGGGGSGYIGNSLLTNKVMYCYNCEESSEESTKTISTTCAEETPTENCAKKGNGYARITYIG